jgi:TRAP-type C4-dicarboxylate transport system substrate-binding protein
LRGEPVKTVEDLKGKKVRVGGNVTGRIISALGGTPVQLPPTEAQQAMSAGVADGITFPLESFESFKLVPVIKSMTGFPGGLYTDTFWLGINEAKWNTLSAQQKAAIEKHSGLAVALLSGWAWTNGDALGRAALERNNTVFFDLPDAEIAKIKTSLKVLEEEWLADAKKRNLPGDEILAYAKTMTEKYIAAKRVNVP